MSIIKFDITKIALSFIAFSGFCTLFATERIPNALDSLKFQGIEFTGSIIYHLDANLLGGIKTGIVNQALLDLGFKFDLNKIFDLDQSYFFVDIQVHEGRNPSYKLTGDNLIFDGISAPTYIQLYEYWFQKKISDFSFKIGRLDAYADFAYIVATNSLLNNSFGAMPTIAGFATYPASAIGAVLSWINEKNYSLRFGVYNGYEGLVGLYKTYRFGDYQDYFSNIIAMTQFEAPFLDQKGRAVLGLTYNTTEFSYYHGPPEVIGFSAYGILEYTTFDQYRYFLQLGVADSTSVLFPYYLGLGCQIDRPFYKHYKNSLTFGYGMAFYSKNLTNTPITKSFESALEVTYRIEYKNIGIQPDVQYLIYPGGRSNPNALAFVFNLDYTI